jgi:hypothetical protein
MEDQRVEAGAPLGLIDRQNRLAVCTGFRVDLSYHPSLSTSLHVALGDDMDFLSTSSIYSLFESPMDGSPGIVLYAVHVF